MENLQKIRSTVIGIFGALTGILIVWKPEVFGTEAWGGVGEWIGGAVVVIGSLVNMFKSNW